MRIAAWMIGFAVLFAASEHALVAQQQQQQAPTTDDVRPVQDESRFKSLARRLGSFASPDRDEGLSVSAGIIVAGSSLSGGAGYRKLDLFKKLDVELDGSVSVRRYQDYRMAIGLLDSRESTLEFDVADRKVASLFNVEARKSPGSAVYLDLRFRDYPRHTYYGTGIDSREDDRADYALRGTSVEGVWHWQVTSGLGISARGGWLDLNVGPGRNDTLLNVEQRFDPTLVPGVPAQPLYVTYGVGVVHETRVEPRAPENGRLLGVSVRRFSASNMPDLSFTRLTADARSYHRVLSDRGVLAMRGLVSTDISGDSGATPFYLQQSLGGAETLRAFHAFRFPDQSLAHVSVEYRWRAHRYVEIAPFIDAGTVAPALSRMSLGSFKMSPGVGIRARTDRRAIARVDVAWGSEGPRIVFGTGPAF